MMRLADELLSMRLAVFTVSPKRPYLGLRDLSLPRKQKMTALVNRLDGKEWK